MPDRRSFGADHTHRPASGDPAGEGVVLPTIREVLRFDDVAAALPEVLAGADHLDRPVRWVHVTETASVAHLVSGGELLLSTGVGWPSDDAGLGGFIAQLVSAGIAGLVLELGVRFDAVPRALVTAATALGLPLIVLHREARFVAITEAVHSRIISDQMAALRARDDIHALFTDLSLRGSPADFIVSQVGRVLGAPVVLENLNHHVVAFEALDAGDDVLDAWEQRSRVAHRSADTDWLITPVEARGIRWGHLIALPGAPHPAGRSNVLEQAAVALALSRLADRDADEWTRQSHEYLLRALIGGRFSSESGLVARFEAAGIAVRGRRLVGLALVSRSDGATASAAQSAPAALAAARDIGVDALAGAHPASPGAQLIVALSLGQNQQLTDHAIDTFARRYAHAASLAVEELVVAVGAEAVDIPGLLASVEEATELLARNGGSRRRNLSVYRVDSRPLLRFINSFGSDPRLQAHSEQMLRPLIEYDLDNGRDLLSVLQAYASNPGNRTKAAASSHLSRSVFYQRIALIEDLLGADLDDGETVSALHAALLARRTSAH